MKDVFASSGDYLRDLGCRTQKLARRVGPTRGILGGLALLGAGVGATFLVRYLRNRNAVHHETVEEKGGGGGAPTKKQRRKAKAHRAAHVH